MRLLDAYREDKRVQQTVRHLQATTSVRLQLSGLIGAMNSFVIAGTHMADPRPMLIIATDKEEAAYLQNNLANLLDKRIALFFPDSFKRPAAYERLDSNNVLQRTEAINRLTSSKAQTEILITYPEAIFEMVVAPQELSKARIEIATEEQLDVDFLIGVLVEYGFERVDFVYEPGQFSIRGGIIDVFSYGNEWPYRIELFDDEVETIRTFDPTSQLSQQNIKRVSIVPNINTRFTQEQKVPLFNVLPSNCIIWFRDFQYMLDRLQFCFEEAGKYANKVSAIDESELAEVLRDRAFLYPNQVIEGLEDFSTILFDHRKATIPIDHKVSFAAKPQPAFQRNFNLLIEDLNKNTKAGLTNYLFTDNPKQIERFYSIFEDLNAQVEFHPVLKAVHQGFVDTELKVAVYTDHQIFERFHRYKLKQGFTKSAALNMRMLRELTPGDFVTHMDHGVGRYSGLEKLEINGRVQESVRLIYKNNDVLYVSINSLHKISKFVGKDGTPPKLSKIGSDAWENLKRKTKRKVKDIAKELIKLYAKRKASQGIAYQADGYLQNELEASFIYEDTPDQLQATIDVKADMEKQYPMDRLICGDVGFGKTEVAIRAAFKAVVNGKQVAILVPTTILALQHFKTFNERLNNFGVTVDYINRFRSSKEKREIFEKLKAGKIDIVIGTHGLLNKEVGFKDLGLLVIDEEQKFGVAAKEKLRGLKVNVDTLTLTATPIPRTLQFSLMAARDLSVIRTPPPNRQPIHTEVRVFNDDIIRESIYYEINRGGQVFFVHNRVKSLPDITAMLRRLCPDVEIASAHGQMDAKNLEKTLLDFIDYRFDVLVCTNIIETGLDIPNANTMIINNAHQFGMSDLHQLRGRVGRSNKKAFCYLFSPPMSTLTSDARKRLQTLEEFSDLGSGFNIAMKDLDIRGAGNLLGGEQSGFISDIGYETYQKILEEAIQELKENEFEDLFKEELGNDRDYVRDVEVDADIEMLLPDDYVENIQERLNLYTELDGIKDEEGIEKFAKRLADRFGKLPAATLELFDALRLRWICKKLGFERLSLKHRKLRCFFVSDPQSNFYESDLFRSFLQYVATKGEAKGWSFKKTHRHFILIKDSVGSLSEAKDLLAEVREELMIVI